MTLAYFRDTLRCVRALFFPPSNRSSLVNLLGWTVGGCLILFGLLQLWRPCFFLTDDNLSSLLPVFTEMGRHLKNGQSPFVSDYLFGGHYDFSRDVGYLYWHPFYLLPALLADTPARFWIIDAVALLFQLLTAVGFTLLAHSLRKEFCPKLPDIYLIFYTLSFVFSTYILMTGASWVNFLGNQSALPWLVLGMRDRKIFRGTALVALFTIHQLVGAYAALTLSNFLLLTVFAAGLAFCRSSPRPFFNWAAGSVIGVLVIAPFVLHMLEGFDHAHRVAGLSLKERSEYFIPFGQFPFSFFLGNWTEPIAVWTGDLALILTFPYPTLLLACAAAWCLLPGLANPTRWRCFEALCLIMAVLIAVLIIRPSAITAAMFHVPLLKSMRWPFREGMQFLFFIHLFIIVRPLGDFARWRPAITCFSLLVFILPLPFVHPPTFNGLVLDRQVLFSGEGEKFWTRVKTQLKPNDEIATVINLDYWKKNFADIPYTLMGTANFPAYYKLPCISGYSTTAPIDQVPIQLIPYFWFGAFRDDQVDEILRERPGLRLLRVESTRPLKITLSDGSNPPIDLSPCLQAAGVTSRDDRSAR